MLDLNERCWPSHRADRVQLEELKIHLRARERINGRVERAPIFRSTRFDGKRNRDNNQDGLIIITDFSDATPSTSSPAVSCCSSLLRLFILPKEGRFLLSLKFF